MLAGVAGIGAIALAAKSAISTFTDFEKSIANAASVTGATGEVFEETKKHITAVSKELGETTVFSASQAANAFYDLASAGYDVANMTKAELKPILDLAAATQNDLAKTTTVVTSTLGQFGLKMDSSSRIADVFAKTIGSSKATINALENSLKYVGPIAKSMGMEIEDVNAILGNLYNAGFKGEQAGTALRGAFARLLNPTTAVIDQLAAMGLTLDDVDPTTRDFADILDTLTAAGMDTASAMALFGVEAAPAMLALTENTDGIRELEAALSDAGGTAETMATQQLDTLSGSMALLKSALEGASITIGEALGPYIRLLAEWLTRVIPPVMKLGAELKKKLTPAFEKLRDFLKDVIPRVKDLVKHFAQKLQPAFKSVQKIAKSLGKIFGTLTADLGSNEDAFSTLTSIVNVAADVLNWIAGVIEDVVNWFAEHPTITKFAIAIAAAVALITSPVLLLIAAVALLAVAWDKDWLGIKTTTIAVTGLIVDIIKYFLGLVTKFWDEWGDDIIKTVEFIWDAVKLYIELAMAAIKVVIDVAMALIKGDWEGAWDAIKDYVVKVGDAIGEFWDKWGKDVKKFFSDLWKKITEGVTGWASDVITVFTDWAEDVRTGFYDWADSILGGGGVITTWISDFISDIAGWASDVLEVISGWITDAKDAFSGWVDSIIGEDGILTGWFNDVLDLFGGLMNIEFSWPSIPNPFAGIDFCVYIPDWFAKWLGICGEEQVVPPSPDPPSCTSHGDCSSQGGDDGGGGCSSQDGDEDGCPTYTAPCTSQGGCSSYTPGCDGQPDAPGEDVCPTFTPLPEPDDPHCPTEGCGCDGKSDDGGDDGCSGQVCNNKGGCPGQPDYAHGGYIPKDSGVNLHAGEFVIPAKGTPVLTSGGRGCDNFSINYKIDKIVGIDDFERRMNQRDRELLRKIRALV